MKFAILCVLSVVLYASSGSELSEDINQGATLAGCDPSACNRACWAFEWAGGNCVDNNCNCFKFIRREKQLIDKFRSDDEESSTRACSPAKCQSDCRRIGANGGMCVMGKCICT